MNTEQEVVPEVSPESSNNKIALYDAISAGLSGMREKYKGPKDLSIPANYEDCRLALAETRGVRGETEKARKKLKADALAYGRLVDSTAKRIIDKVLEIETPYSEAKKAYDTSVEIAKREKALAEERRVDGIAGRIAGIGALVAAHVSSSSEIIEGLLLGLENDLFSCGIWAMEFSEKAESTIKDTYGKILELHTMKVQHEQAAADKLKADKEEAEKAEADRLQREKEAEAERERLAKERKDLEDERAAMQAEREKLDKEQAEKDRVAKEEQDEKDRAAEKERARLAKEIEELKKSQEPVPQEVIVQDIPTTPGPTTPGTTVGTLVEPDNDHEKYKAAGRAIMAIVGSKPVAKAILDAIIFGKIPNVAYTA